jgi:hypothetical protein
LISSAFPTKTNWRVSVGKYLAMIWLAFAKSSHQHFFEIVYKRFVKIIPEHLCQQAGLLFGSFVSWGNCPLHNFSRSQ